MVDMQSFLTSALLAMHGTLQQPHLSLFQPAGKLPVYRAQVEVFVPPFPRKFLSGQVKYINKQENPQRNYDRAGENFIHFSAGPSVHRVSIRERYCWRMVRKLELLPSQRL